MKAKTWNISSSGKSKLDAIETSVRKVDEAIDVGSVVRVVLKNTETGKPEKVDEANFNVYAALWRDAFDEKTNRALYVLVREGEGKATNDEADKLVDDKLANGAHELGETFDGCEPAPAAADGAEKPCRALVKAGGEPAAIVPEVVDPDTGCRVDNGDFKLTSGPTPAEMRKAVLDEIEGAEKGVSSARSRMKKLALQIADLCAGSLPCGDAVTDYKIAQGEWMSETSALAGAQQRLRNLDAEIAEGKLS